MNNERKYGLLELDIERIISIFEANPKIDNVILFGSRAIGTYKPGSDIDIVLKGTDVKLIDILNFNAELDKLSLPYKFDIIIYDRITENALIEHIKRVGISLFERKKPSAQQKI
ncbi:MAG: nucleotidyltransferase domain-containing protein [Bacteroidales bacterium]